MDRALQAAGVRINSVHHIPVLDLLNQAFRDAQAWIDRIDQNPTESLKSIGTIVDAHPVHRCRYGQRKRWRTIYKSK